ncbi:D-aspartate oxidase-like [Musca vetustissima]|uniref:D-aspartate oxidase-like n=1 Tax=Musca vetustissima TaxID=27455 RepID=UPI002AB7D6B0|nr:D-aspartate oxidase-like [Musca vetustissima]
MRVAILGGGINGFCCAVRIQVHYKKQNRPIEVTVLSEKFSPNTTGDGSAGLWGPFLLGGTPTAKVHQWSKGMHDFLEELWLSEDAGEAGVCLLPVIRLTTADTPVDDFWKDIVYGCHEMTEEMLKEYNENRTKKYTSGLHFITYTSEPRLLLPYLMKRFEKHGGKIVQQKIDSLEKFLENSDYDVVINCTGLGSQQVIGDNKMLPIRGQVARVKAPWLYYSLLDESDDGNYIIPNMDTVVLGGTHQEHDYNIIPCPKDKKFIMEGCENILPALKNATHLFDWVGLRPGRSALRLEGEQKGKHLVIHNYGHGGSGVTLAWGCAADVLAIMEQTLQKQHQQKAKL